MPAYGVPPTPEDSLCRESFGTVAPARTLPATFRPVSVRKVQDVIAPVPQDFDPWLDLSESVRKVHGRPVTRPLFLPRRSPFPAIHPSAQLADRVRKPLQPASRSSIQ